jgi:hypothetical protein
MTKYFIIKETMLNIFDSSEIWERIKFSNLLINITKFLFGSEQIVL